MTVKLWLYSRAGCHLCDEMLKELEALQRTTAGIFTVDVLDIGRDPELHRRYSLRIPVLAVAASGEVLCEARFNRKAVLDHLTPSTQ